MAPRIKCLLSGAVVFFSFILFAELSCADEYTKPGPYLGAAVAGGFSQFSNGERSLGDSAGFDIRGGYRFNDYFAAEGLYEYMDDFSRERGPSHSLNGRGDLATNSFSLLGKALLPIPGVPRLQPYVDGGVGFLNADGSHAHFFLLPGRSTPSGTDFAGRVDGGVDVFLTKRIATFMDLGYVMPTGHLSDLPYLSFNVGAKYRF